MLSDRYGLALDTSDDAAREAYVAGCDLLLTLYPGAIAALNRVIAADPDFVAAYVAKARAQQVGNDLAGARATLAAAEGLARKPSARDASQLAVLRHLFAGQGDAALANVRSHVATWPRDALVLSITANQIGLFGMSGRRGREQELADFLDSLAPHYGEDWWFDAHFGMALSEVSQQGRARPLIERSLAQYPRNGYVAHAMGHLCYETDQHAAAITFMRSWLLDYPRTGTLHGHLHWHLAVSELQLGNFEEGLRLFTEAFAADDYPAAAMLKLVDGAAFLWRAESAGHPRDPARWRIMHDFAERMFPKAGMPMVDWHVALIEAVAGDGETLAARVAEMEALLAAGRFPCGPAVPALVRGLNAFARKDFATAIAALEPVMPERERICGSRAQIDLVEGTLIKACLEIGRMETVQRLLRDRRPGPAPVPVAGSDARH